MQLGIIPGKMIYKLYKTINNNTENFAGYLSICSKINSPTLDCIYNELLSNKFISDGWLGCHELSYKSSPIVVGGLEIFRRTPKTQLFKLYPLCANQDQTLGKYLTLDNKISSFVWEPNNIVWATAPYTYHLANFQPINGDIGQVNIAAGQEQAPVQVQPEQQVAGQQFQPAVPGFRNPYFRNQ